MDAREAIRLSIDMGNLVSMSYLEDLTDEEMMRRPHPKCNHINWQVGHLISSEHHMVSMVRPGSMPDLPEGFNEKYNPANAGSDDPSAFCRKSELLSLAEQVRNGTLEALSQCSDSDLDVEAPESMRSHVKNLGALFSLQGSHWLMHAGQWAVVRRQLGRPPLF